LMESQSYGSFQRTAFCKIVIYFLPRKIQKGRFIYYKQIQKENHQTKVNACWISYES
jgi:hypothetical protein